MAVSVTIIVVAVVVIATILGLWWWRRKRRQREEAEDEGRGEDSDDMCELKLMGRLLDTPGFVAMTSRGGIDRERTRVVNTWVWLSRFCQ